MQSDGGTPAEEVEQDTSRVETTVEDGHGRQTWKDADPLEEFEFDGGETFVAWAPWGAERKDDDEWRVVGRSWQYTVTWITERDMPPVREHHRIYKLRNTETWDTIRIDESELKRGDWKPLEEVDDGAE